MLEGKELEKKIGDIGEVSVDVDTKGKVTVELKVAKEIEGVSVASVNKAEVHLITILEKMAKNSKPEWDDTVIAQVKAILGLIG